MESPFSYLSVVSLYMGVINFLLLSHAIESPPYTLLHAESGYEIRLYRDITWVCAPVQGTSFQKSTKDGFHRIYQYIHGSNINSTGLPLTAPVLTSITSSAQQGSVFSVVGLFISGGSPPQPSPELNLQLVKWRAQCIAVRKFAGFAKDDNINKQVEALVSSLNEHLKGSTAVLGDKSSFSIAQYNASYHLSERLNEVWMNISGLSAQGCLPYMLRD